MYMHTIQVLHQTVEYLGFHADFNISCGLTHNCFFMQLENGEKECVKELLSTGPSLEEFLTMDFI